MHGRFIGEISPFGMFHEIDLADQVGDRHIRRRQFLMITIIAMHPFDLCIIPLLGEDARDHLLALRAHRDVERDRAHVEPAVVHRERHQAGLEMPVADVVGDLGRVLPDRAHADVRVALAEVLDQAREQGFLEPAHRDLLRHCERAGYPIGLAGAVIFAVGGGTANLTGLMVSIITAPFLAAAYAASLLRFFQRRTRIADVVAPAGRMALTNYLGQSLLCVLVFTGVGLGLAGRTTPAETLAIAVMIFLVQLAASTWWMRRFRYGPVEGVLRAWTYGGWKEAS